LVLSATCVMIPNVPSARTTRSQRVSRENVIEQAMQRATVLTANVTQALEGLQLRCSVRHVTRTVQRAQLVGLRTTPTALYARRRAE
jgi:hypothetical protein